MKMKEIGLGDGEGASEASPSPGFAKVLRNIVGTTFSIKFYWEFCWHREQLVESGQLTHACEEICLAEALIW